MATRSSWNDRIPPLSDDPTHPTQIALRTYALALALSLGPSLIPFITAWLGGQKSPRTNLLALKRVLRRELGHDGFAFAITLSVGGGAALRHFWNTLDTPAVSLTKSPDLAPGTIMQGKEAQDAATSAGTVTCMTTQLWESISGPVKEWLKKIDLSPEQRTLTANAIASSVGILLLQAGRERALKSSRATSLKAKRRSSEVSPTLDLTLLLVVRALDCLVQSLIHTQSGGKMRDEKPKVTHQHHSAAEPRLVKDMLEKEQRKRKNVLREKLTTRLDAVLFWACSARIMWCFFYEPQKLPRSYVKWINTLANVDPRLIKTLNYLRERKWAYRMCNPDYINYLKPYAMDLGRPASWADPNVLPAYGGTSADTLWKTLGVTSRPSVGGLPCELVHGEVGSSLGLSHSCLANTSLRGMKAFMEAIAIYIPAHFLPILMTRPQTLLRPHRFLQTLFGAFRSATFLSTFVASYWFAVCFTRSLVLAKYLPFISHNFWDGPFGCLLAGSLLCGSSIWVENGRRRGEMALYVMPKAFRACLPDNWVKARNQPAKIAERTAIVMSISMLLTAAIHRPESLRGLSRWTLAFIMNGPNAGFWKRKRSDPSIPPTPSFPPTTTVSSIDGTPSQGPSRSQTPGFVRYPHNASSIS
ncbi:hypothetical protein P691DRAFT_755182 [Macrolepiota fuliginosa MF-IS2]|uniref:Transmembrane protein 135 N-terminal domain-containing protein n=1 Tax=Macrolepiota fuliginosa MF-IS2 TaxID=1400762 RepID=A0A9P5XQ86_9AGAR|nr:hypothetical protein P691DRAFT_755182 [Macrolepiota fuliginosa MF-IS2]